MALGTSRVGYSKVAVLLNLVPILLLLLLVLVVSSVFYSLTANNRACCILGGISFDFSQTLSVDRSLPI